MSEEQAKNGTKQQSNKTGGLSFAVTLVAALVGTSLYTKNYFRNTPVDDPFLYLFVCKLIPVGLILVGGLLLYILVKGFSVEVQDPERRKYLENGASCIYQGTFLMFIMLLVFILCVFFFAILKFENIWYVQAVIICISFLVGAVLVLPRCVRTVIICISFLVGAVLVLPRFNREWKEKKYHLSEAIQKFRGIFKNPPLSWIILVYLLYIFLVALLLWLFLFQAVFLYFPIQGHVTVDMESVYYKSDAPIPVLIHVTGPNPILSIYLSEENSSHDLKEIYNLTLKPEHNPSKTEYSENSTLVGNALNYGTYNVFINTTGLSAGYYELKCIRYRYEKMYGVRGFYLLNSSRQSGIKE